MKQAATDQEVDGHPLASGEVRRQGARSALAIGGHRAAGKRIGAVV